MIATDQLVTIPVVELPASRAASLRRWNISLGFLHAVQAIAILALATAFTLPVTGTFMEGPPGTAPGAPTTLFEVSVAWGVALFLLLSAGFHWLVALPRLFVRARTPRTRTRAPLTGALRAARKRVTRTRTRLPSRASRAFRCRRGREIRG